MPAFSNDEQTIRNFFPCGTTFFFDKCQFAVVFSGKPTCPEGEPKTDVFIRSRRISDGQIKDFKISYKKSNADFLENKMSAVRAEQILGPTWRNIIVGALAELNFRFSQRKLIFKHSHARTEEGCFTIGWKFEFVNSPGGELSGRLNLTTNQLIDIYAGTNQSDIKKNAWVNNQEIPGSGIAEYILIGENFLSAQDIINHLQSIVCYVQQNPAIYFACKALNYRSLHMPPKWDGNRPLSAYVSWQNINNRLHHHIILDDPLQQGGDNIGLQLLNALASLHIKTTDDITHDNVDDYNIVYDQNNL